jgi:uncharacterized membrane protein YgcG
MTMLISILVIAGLLFGGGVTVNAAQDDLPDQPLYQLKLMTEGVSLQFQNRPEEKVERLMELAQIRFQEMVQLAEKGNPVPDQARQRLEQHIQQALQVCSEMEDAELEGCLVQLQEQLQHQYREMEQLMTNAPEGVEPILEQTRAMLRLHLNLVEDGLLDPAMFRNTVRNGFRFGQEDDFVPPAQNGSGQQNGQPASVPGGPNTDPGDMHNHGNEMGPQPNDGGPNNVNGDPNSNNGGENSNQGGNGDGGENSGGGENGGGDSGGGGNGGGGSGGN